MEAVETLEIKGFKAEVYHDDSYDQNPNDTSDNSVVLVYDHRQFAPSVEGFVPLDIHKYLNGEKGNKTLFDKYQIWVVYAYIHSGVSLSLGRSNYPFNDPWDVSSTGFLLIKKSVFRNAIHRLKIAQDTIKEWNDYLSGNAHGFKVFAPLKPEDEGEPREIESGWGYLGDPDYCLKEAKAIIMNCLTPRQLKLFTDEKP